MLDKDKFRLPVIISIIILFLYFLIRLINQSQMTYVFPIDAYANDYSSHIAHLYFLDVYGYGNVVPNWYNGNYPLFAFYPPLWHFFTLPWYYLSGDVLAATFISLILMYIIGFLLIYFFSKLNNVSRLESVLFWLFFFANPIAIGVFLRLGKMPEMFGWLFFILFATAIFYYKDRKIDWRFLIIFTLVYTLFMYAHTLVFIISSFLVISLFLVKKTWRERAYIAISCLLTAVLTSPVWYNLVTNASKISTSPSFFPLKWLISSSPGTITDKVTAFVVPVIFWIIFYLYFVTNNKSKRILKFFIVPLIASVLYFSRILVFVPYLNRATPDMYNVFFIFLSCYMLFNIKVERLNLIVKKTLYFGLLLLPLIGVIISAFYTPWFYPHTKEVNDTFYLVSFVDKNFLVLNPPRQVSAVGTYSYGAIYYNTSTPSGWSPLNLTLEDRQRLQQPDICLDRSDCNCLKDSLSVIKTKQVISYSNSCTVFEACRFRKIKEQGDACLYEYNY